ncbi:MAG TPA: hypothetical protein VKR06_20465 [Ktedonosporobacter sp.]|nr:hypothetical protein [Ktedonosporobacter sp.]
MSSSTLYRLSGISLIWGGGFIALGYALHPAGDNPKDLANPLQIPVHLMIFFGIFLLLLGLIGLYARQSSRVGILGLAGLLLLFFALPMIEMPHTVAGFGLFPVLATKVPPQEALTLINSIFDSTPLGIMSAISVPMAVLGTLISGIVTFRAHFLSRGIAMAFFSIIGIEILSLIPGVSDVMILLKFPAEIYLCFAAVGFLVLLDKGKPQLSTASGKDTPGVHAISGKA